MEFIEVQNKLRLIGIKFEDGLSEHEINKIEQLYTIEFPNDLKEFLTLGLPISEGFPNWRDFSQENVSKIVSQLEWPLEGILFDIESNSFWFDSWGDKPDSFVNQLATCKEKFIEVPKMIPIYSHRYIPSTPNESGNPVFSIYQTDIIYYGDNLSTYFEVEFFNRNLNTVSFKSIRKIQFWSEI